MRYPTKLIVDYLAREIVEGGLVDDLLAMACSTGSIHLDIDTYGAILNDEREKEIATPLDAASLSPPSASSSSSPPPPPPSTTVDSAAPSTTPFRAHAHLIGPSLLRNFPLPDFSPPLYRPGGTRAALQSFNMLTSEVQLKLSGSSLDRITFERASIAFDPAVGSRGGELVVTVEDLTVLLKSRFSLHADTSSVISWTTGVKRIGEQGSSTTKVEARSLQLRFVLVRSSSAREGAPFVLKESSMSPFTSVEPRFQLDNQLAKLGAEVVNVVTAQLKVSSALSCPFLGTRWRVADALLPTDADCASSLSTCRSRHARRREEAATGRHGRS